MSPLLNLLSLGLEILRGGGGGREVSSKDWLEEGSENDLGTTVVLVSMGSLCMESMWEHTRSGEEPSRERGRT